MGEVESSNDFWLPPDQLVKRDEIVKVALILTKDSIDYFKKEAKNHHTQYQKMIRSLLDQYAEHYKKTGSD